MVMLVGMLELAVGDSCEDSDDDDDVENIP